MINKNRLKKLITHSGFWIVSLGSLASFVPVVITRSIAANPEPSLEVSPSLSPQRDIIDNLPLASTLTPVDDEILLNSTLKTPEPYSATRNKVTTAQRDEGTAESNQPKTSSQGFKTSAPPSQLQQNQPVSKPKTQAKTYSNPQQVRRQQSQLARYIAPQVEIRVAILTGENTTMIGSSTSASILDANGKVLKTIPPNQGFWAQANGSSLTIDNHQLPSVVWIQASGGGVVAVGDRWYRGKILLVCEGNTLLGVNYVDLEHYLYSVVGSEMHATAPMEALKAQAIAARSYALVHLIRPASRWYNLGSTQRWQVYKGIGSEYNTSQRAVNETAGQILSYQGGVVESLYAATDDIVARVHRGRGMSQTGAYKLAGSGYDYQQILGVYYPGVELAQIVLGQ